ncbi:MAG: hypothetical protein OSJ70_08625 [Bacilli bacterium]|nr:hypothetical protein [Bacilli bacterium]
MKTLRKKILFASIILLAILYIPDHQYKSIDIQEVFSENDNVRIFNYSLGQVFIGDYNTIKKMVQTADETDIFIVDYRKIDDPDMQVISSYKIKNIDIINEILEIMLYYEKTDPTNWNRTLSSMRNEWEMHNYSYFFHYDEDRTRDVDLNNADENKYRSEILRKVLRN